jgi:hypothetical protein
MAERRGGRIPLAAAWLGGGGALPFVAGALWIWTGPATGDGLAVRIVVIYGAVILAFLGGMVWGLASAQLVRDPVEPDVPRLLAVSVLPALVAVAAAFLGREAALIVLALSFACALLIDRWLDKLRFAPIWWLRLRIRLSAVVIVSLLLVLIGLDGLEGGPGPGRP